MILEHPRIFGNLCKTTEKLHGVLFYWDPKCHKMKLKKSKKDYYALLKRLTFHFSLIFLLILQGFSRFQSAQVQSALTFIDQFLYAICILCNTCNHFSHWNSLKHRENICMYINGLVQFHSNYKKSSALDRQPMSLLKLLLWACVFGLFGTCYLLPVAYSYPLHWMNPCKPSLVGYWLLPECHGFQYFAKNDWSSILFGVIGTILKVAVMLVNHWIWAFGCHNAIFSIGGLMLMCTMSLKECVEKFQEASLDRQKPLDQIATMYRNIQVLAIFMNKIQQRSIMAIIIIIATLLQATAMTTVIKLLPRAGENLIGLATFGMVVIDASIWQTVILGGMAGIYTNCEETFQMLMKKLHIKQKNGGTVDKDTKWRRRFYKSCPFVKVCFGSFNYVDALTPLSCIDFGNDLTINFLLLES